ncbi:Lipopolysaccharide core heptosyltransferase RfaQ [Novipirellula galeiformis]|uniref:Lipopolysaccharide core heptosyltransferase RfaQ n=1 Tax=Novipirellula galeiformis TaxID=2528004 RepID=A0A5C6C1I7_9BACT|nr:glycosyltransferase family 9 protein [Novipirellula galeiformis]TWU17376.1 Lipopolysaccharide core heptosyltransferase RfaQ [Novipirellula galeiformis]
MSKPKTESRRGPRILIARLSAIGDAILTLPVACALRAKFPDAYLGWVVERKAAPMVRGHRALDAVISLERNWFLSPKGIHTARAQLRPHRFDISLDCQGNTKSALAGWISGANQRIGYAGQYGGELSRLMNNVRIAPAFRHLTDRSLELLTPLGLRSPSVHWDLPVSDASVVWASRWRRTIPSKRIAVLNPGGTWPSKRWEASRFAQTAVYLKHRYGYQSAVVWGTGEERAMADKIVAQADGAAVLAPHTDLHHLAALISNANLFISGDTGPLHIAVAVGTPTIGLYGATRPGDSGPYGQIAIQKAYESSSRRQRSNANNSAMRAIQVADVCAAIDELQGKQPLVGAA